MITPIVNGYLPLFIMPSRLRVVPYFSSRIVEGAKRERAWKSPHSRKARRVVASSRVGWFSRVLAFRSLYYPWGKMGTTRSLIAWYNTPCLPPPLPFPPKKNISIDCNFSLGDCNIRKKMEWIGNSRCRLRGQEKVSTRTFLKALSLACRLEIR